MALQDRLRRSATKLLAPGEQVQAVIATQSWHPVVQVAGVLWIFLLGGRYMLVVATDRRIVVMRTELLSYKKPVAIIGEIPRSTRLGPVSSWPASIRVSGYRLYVIGGSKEFVALADGQAG